MELLHKAPVPLAGAHALKKRTETLRPKDTVNPSESNILKAFGSLRALVSLCREVLHSLAEAKLEVLRISGPPIGA